MRYAIDNMLAKPLTNFPRYGYWTAVTGTNRSVFPNLFTLAALYRREI